MYVSNSSGKGLYFSCVDKNIFGEPLRVCCTTPLTGYFRDGYCRTDQNDYGSHTVCVIVTEVLAATTTIPSLNKTPDPGM